MYKLKVPYYLETYFHHNVVNVAIQLRKLYRGQLCAYYQSILQEVIQEDYTHFANRYGTNGVVWYVRDSITKTHKRIIISIVPCLTGIRSESRDRCISYSEFMQHAHDYRNPHIPLAIIKTEEV